MVRRRSVVVVLMRSPSSTSTSRPDGKWCWYDDGMVVLGHDFDVFCTECGDGDFEALVGGDQFLWTCRCTFTEEVGEEYVAEPLHTFSVAPAPSWSEWSFYGTHGSAGEIESLDSAGVLVSFTLRNVIYRWRVESESLFQVVSGT
jgi:hypothetical protein